MTWTTMELLRLVCLCVLTWSGSTSADGNGPDVVKVVVKEGEDAILPCSLSTTENIEFKLFDWKKDGQKEVFFYDAGFTYGNNKTGQDEQFRGRVFHFRDQLEVGNASILIKQTKVTDSGNYTCDFPRLQPQRRFHIELVVGPDVVKVVVKEGEDAILPCSLSTKENIEFKLFDWKKDGQKEVFFYDAGLTYGNGLTGQDDQFKQRVFHFPDQLKVGDASILIKQIKVTDRGNYTCDFPRLQPQRRFHIELVVALILKDRTEENIPGVARKPYVTKDNAVLQCQVQGAFPKPQLQWQDRGGNIVPAEKPQVTERGGRYDVILQTTVTKTDHYRCVVTQEEINHQVYSDIIEYVGGSGFPTGWGR